MESCKPVPASELPRNSPTVLRFPDIDSTNEEALRQIKAGAPAPLWIVADKQSKGRGRSGRNWESPPGNLYASCLLKTNAPPAKATELSFVAALAVHDAISSFLLSEERHRLTVKWPNDVMLKDAKLAGVLLESIRLPAERGLGVVLGVGINVASTPSVSGRPVTSLAEYFAMRDSSLTSNIPALADLFEALANALEARKTFWNEGAGFDAIRSDWLARAYALQGAVTVNLNGKTIQGKFIGVDNTGALKLEIQPGMVITITAGDVYSEGAR